MQKLGPIPVIKSSTFTTLLTREYPSKFTGHLCQIHQKILCFPQVFIMNISLTFDFLFHNFMGSTLLFTLGISSVPFIKGSSSTWRNNISNLRFIKITLLIFLYIFMKRWGFDTSQDSIFRYVATANWTGLPNRPSVLVVA